MNDLDNHDEDDVEEERGYCNMHILPLRDPLSQLTCEHLADFRYTNKWDRFDQLEVVPSDEDERGAEARINGARIPLKRKVGRDHSEGMLGLVYETYNYFPLFAEQCPYCQVETHCEYLTDREEDLFAKLKALEYCPNCHFWRWHDTEVEIYDEGFDHKYLSLLSKIREFEGEFPEGFSQEFAAWIRRNQRRWHTMKPMALEKLAADVLRYNFQPCEVIHVGKPGDGGVDVLFIDSGQKQWMVQVKRREKPDCSEPIETVRNLLGTMWLNDVSCGMVISTADHFTYQAYKAVDRAREKGVLVELIDRGKLNRMLNAVLPDRPWAGLLRSMYPEIADHFIQSIPSSKYEQLLLPFEQSSAVG